MQNTQDKDNKAGQATPEEAKAAAKEAKAAAKEARAAAKEAKAAAKMAKPVRTKQEKLRLLRNGTYSSALTAIVIAGAVALNLVAQELPSNLTQIDVSEAQLSVITDQTKEIAENLTEDVTLYYIVQDTNIDTTVERLLERYEDASSHIAVVQKDPVRFPNFTSRYTEDSVTENSVIVVCGDESRVVSYSDMYESSFNYTYYSYTTTGFDAEGQLTSAIASVTDHEKPVVYRLTGHGDADLDSTMKENIEKENITLEELNLVTSDEVPEDASCLLISGLSTDLSEQETEKIEDYMTGGGHVIILLAYTGKDMPNLTGFLELYGLETAEGVVLEGDPRSYVQVPYYIVPEIESGEVSSDMTGGNSYVLLAAALGLTVSEDADAGLTITEVLTTSDSAYVKTDPQNMTTYSKEDGDIDGPFVLGALVTGELTETAEEDTDDVEAASEEMSEATSEAADADAEDSTEAESEDEADEEDSEPQEMRLAVYTSTTLVDSSSDQMVSGGNSRLFLNTLSWMCGHTTTVSIPVKSLEVDYLTMTAAGSNFWSVIVIGIVPAVILACGLVVWVKRRRR